MDHQEKQLLSVHHGIQDLNQEDFHASIRNKVDHITNQLQQLLFHLANPAAPPVAMDTVTHSPTAALNILRTKVAYIVSSRTGRANAWTMVE